MFIGSRFCARCGAEATRELLDDVTPIPCPRCREPMQSLRLGDTNARECSACGGLWLDPESLQKLANGREAQAAVVSLLAARIPTATAPVDAVRYFPCPSCTKLMNRVNFAHSSGVVLDVCKTHGVWLDRGELQRVLAFIAAGGLTVAREHDRERERAQLAQDRLLAARLTIPDHGAAARSRFADGSFAAIDPSATSLAHLLLDALGLFH